MSAALRLGTGCADVAARADYGPASGHSSPFEQRRQDAHLSKSKQDMKQEESHENEQPLEARGGMRGARGNTCDGRSRPMKYARASRI